MAGATFCNFEARTVDEISGLSKKGEHNLLKNVLFYVNIKISKGAGKASGEDVPEISFIVRGGLLWNFRISVMNLRSRTACV